jgi:transposase
MTNHPRSPRPIRVKSFAEFLAAKVQRGELRRATPEELASRVCSGFWHRLEEHKRAGECSECGQRMSGWLYST